MLYKFASGKVEALKYKNLTTDPSPPYSTLFSVLYCVRVENRDERKGGGMRCLSSATTEGLARFQWRNARKVGLVQELRAPTSLGPQG